MPPIRRKAGAGSTPSRRARPATPSAATATASSIPPPSGGSPTRPRCSSITRAIITAPGSPTRWKSRRSPARLPAALGLDEDLAEALALAHDLGHPPFGHSGERALDQCLKRFGGFDHNAQGLRIVTELERRYPGFDGLNLTWETLEGLVKHNGPLTDRDGAPIGRYAKRGVPDAIRDYMQVQDLELWSFASAEAQVAAISDDIAYDAHDIDDGLRADLFTFDEIAAVGFCRRHRTRYRLALSRPRADASRACAGAPADRPHDRGRRSPRPGGVWRCWSRDRPPMSAMPPAPRSGFRRPWRRRMRDIKGFLSPRMYRHDARSSA